MDIDLTMFSDTDRIWIDNYDMQTDGPQLVGQALDQYSCDQI